MKFFIDLKNAEISKEEILEKVLQGKTALRENTVFTDILEEATGVITDSPEKYYPRKGRTVFVTREGMGVMDSSMGWLDFPDLAIED